MIHSIKIKTLQFYPGFKAGLGQKTALVELELDNDVKCWSAEKAGLPDRILTLYPAAPLFGIKATDWPAAFVSNSQNTSGFAHWVVALCVAMQRWSHEPAYQGEVLIEEGKCIRLALPWHRELVFRGALQMALKHLLVWSKPAPDPASLAQLAVVLKQTLEKFQPGGLAPNTLRFAIAAASRKIPISSKGSILFLGWGSMTQRLESSFTGQTSNIAARIARNKHFASVMLHQAGLPIPPTSVVADWKNASAVAAKLDWPVVVKPSNQDQGIGVVPGIRDEVLLRKAYDFAAKLSPGEVIVEKHIDGDDHRLLVFGGKLRMATRRVPGGVRGDGSQTISQLIEILNADPLRGNQKRSLMMRLSLDEEATSCLAEQGFTSDSVPDAGHFVRLRRTANISTGGVAEDVTAEIHPDNCRLAERAARIIGLDIAGVDFLCPDISRSWRDVGGAICEINAQPGFRPHWLSDPERDINGEIIDWLFKDKPARIPVSAITGTNGKSTVAKMLHHIWMTGGQTAGACTSSGVWIGDELVTTANLSGFPGAMIVLNDPAVEAAVIELPRKGLIRFGHPCNNYDVAALLNIQDDHIGVEGIENLQQMADFKAQVLERASQTVVINADDELCLAVRDRTKAPRLILVSRDELNPAVQTHLKNGGEAVWIMQHQSVPWIVMAEESNQTLILPLHTIPATMNGLLRHNETNALFATAMARAHGIEFSTIRSALSSFANSPEQNPGRYNMIEGFPFQMLLDFGHNPDGVREICDITKNLKVSGKRRLLCRQVGNRHKAHLLEVVPVIAQCFDSFVVTCAPKSVNQCKDYAGEDPVGNMLAIFSEVLQSEGILPENLIVERDSDEAIRKAIGTAEPGDLLVILADTWEAMAVINSLLIAKTPL